MASIERKENNEVVLTIEVSKEDFANALMESYKKNKSRFQIPGFRKGKVPYHLVKQYYGEGILYDDAIDLAANPAYRAALDEHKLDVVSRPELDILEIGGEKGLVFSITVTEKPSVTLGKYIGVEAPYHYHAAAQSDVDAELARVQERNSRLIPVEGRPVQDGDTATIDYEGFVDGVAFDGGKGEGHDLKIGSGSFIPGFEEQLIGHSIDESFPITVMFPEEYHSEELKGKEATFQVTIHNIKVKEMPELDDEFAKDVSDFDTLEEYKADILAKKEETARTNAENSFKNSVVDVVAENATVEVPDCMIESEVDQMIEDQSMRMRYQGIELQQYLQYIGQTMEQFKEGMRDAAARRVKQNLVVEAVVKAESIEAAEEDVAAELEKMAKQYGMTVEDLKKNIDGNDAFIRENIAMQKAVDKMTEAAVKTEFHDHEHGEDCDCGHEEKKPAKKAAAKAPAKKPAKSKTAKTETEGDAE